MKNSFLFLVFLIVSSLSFIQPQFDPLCGFKSFLVICEKFGVKTTLDELSNPEIPAPSIVFLVE